MSDSNTCREVLLPITARALPRPAYNNCHVGNFQLWFAENEPALVSFYNSLTPYVDGEPLDDYFRWTVVTHEVEQMRVEAGTGPLSASDLEATMCTCHGLERTGEPCIDNCGKVRL